jgi:hypothetical protein
MPRNPEFDPSKPYATTRAIKNANNGAKYVQEGRLYTVTGEYVGVAPGHKAPAPKPAVVPQAAKKSEADKKREALASAANKLNLDAVPESVKDAARENAEALAAEENAE